MTIKLGAPKICAMNTQANQIIDALGGTAEVARICQIKPPSVSEWRDNGIPQARIMFLRLLRPDVFEAIDGEKKAA